MNIEFKVKKCNCCFPFYCGHKKIIISNWNYDLLMMALSKSEIIEEAKLK